MWSQHVSPIFSTRKTPISISNLGAHGREDGRGLAIHQGHGVERRAGEAQARSPRVPLGRLLGVYSVYFLAAFTTLNMTFE